MILLEVPTDVETSIDKHNFIIITLNFLERNFKILEDE